MPRRGRGAILALVAAAVVAVPAATARPTARITVFAAASLTRILPQIDSSPRYEFGGSNALALQIQQGAPADVYVSANPKYVAQLRSQKLLAGSPVYFAADKLVLMVPSSNPAHIRTPADLLRPGVRLVLAAVGVPAGDYARKSLHGMGLDGALANVVSNEPDVEGVVAKLALGEADAGFAYLSDARAVGSKVKLVPLPPAGRFVAIDGAGVVAGSSNATAARAFVARLLAPAAQKKLRAAGFDPVPARVRRAVAP